MQNEKSQLIVARFFLALNYLVADGQISGKKGFCEAVGCDRRNFFKIERNYGSSIFQNAWLTYIVMNYRISADWLLTGRGQMIW